MMKKQYALRIENNEHGLIFHMLFTEKEFKESNIWVGRVELFAPVNGVMAPHINSRVVTLYDLFLGSRKGEINDGELELI